MSHDPFAPIDGNTPDGEPTAEQEQTVGDTVRAQQEAAEQESKQQTQPSEDVPKGTRAEVMDWVGTDKNRAKAALKAEKKSDQPRKTLVAELEGLTG